MFELYQKHVQERKQKNLPPKPLSADWTNQLIDQIKDDGGCDQALFDILDQGVPPGVDEAAYIKVGFLSDIAHEKLKLKGFGPAKSIDFLSRMKGGYNVQVLVDLLALNSTISADAAKVLCNIILVYDHFNDVVSMHKKGNAYASGLLKSWAKGDWFLNLPKVPDVLELSVFRVQNEINTDDLSPATEAWSRPDIPLHAQSMLVSKIDDASNVIQSFKDQHKNIVFVGDVVGTGSSRKSAMNSLMWHFGKPTNQWSKQEGGVVLGKKIAPIFFTTAEDSGVLPIECDVQNMKMGDKIYIHVQEGIIKNKAGDTISSFAISPTTLLDEVRAGGRIQLMIGRSLTDKAADVLGTKNNVFVRPESVIKNQKFTLAQKIVGRACGVEGVAPNTYCEPKMTTVGSQDTTGAMTRDELKDLACLGFSADLVMQSFCHTAAYPKPVDIELQHTLPDFIMSRGGVSLRPGDGIIHSILNRMLLPDTVGTGGDSHTRFPLGISFPAGSGLVAFAATSGVMPLNMPESVLVRFSGKMQPGITLRDLVNAIPYVAMQKGLLNLDKRGKENIFSGRILEIEGLPDLRVEQAFELSDASAERSANGCTIRLNEAPIFEYLQSNIVLLKDMIQAGYGNAKTLARRIESMQEWLDEPQLLQPDEDCEYACEIDIDLNTITEPLLACPNDPDDIKPLSQVSGDTIDEVFIGSCMTNIGHFRAAAKLLEGKRDLPVRLWVVPPTRMDQHQLIDEGYYSIFGQAGARTETPGCSLCMGNQARTRDGAHVMSTSTRNFPNRMGKGAMVYLGSAELSAICAIEGKIPDVETYQKHMQLLVPLQNEIYRYLNFHQLMEYVQRTNSVSVEQILKG